MTETVFSKILSGEIPADIVFEDDQVLAFRDNNPKAPTHVLVIPRKPISSVAEASDEDRELLGHCLRVCAQVAEDEGVREDGYRIVANIGNHGGQTVFHLHFHVLGGRPMTWPPG